MKKILSSLLMVLAITASLKAQYPVGDPGDNGYDILIVKWPVGVEYTGSTWGYLPDCNNFQTSLNFTYPSRETDPVGTEKFTLMKYEIYKQNYITGAFSLAYAQNSVWMIDPASLVNGNPTIQHNMAPNGEYFTAEPFHLYYVKIWTRKGKINIWGNVVPVTTSLKNTGYTESFNFGKCENDCRDYPGFGWDLGVLPSSPSNQASGYYHPKYETDNHITSTTPLGANEELILDAGTYVKLLPGFHASYSSDFHAYIDGCGGQRIGQFPDEEANVTDEPSGINVLENVNVYPNPTSGEFTVDLGNNENESSIYVMDLTGRILYSNENTSQTTERFNLRDQESGIYLVKVISNGKVAVKKIVKN